MTNTKTPKVEIYSDILCYHCYRAIILLKNRRIPFDEINVSLNPVKRREMLQRTNGSHTIPQIFINDQHIGGCDELYALDREGKLQQMLKAE